MKTATLLEVEPNGSLTVLTLSESSGRRTVCYAETRMFLNAVADCYGDDWQGQSIEYETDSCNVMVWFRPADEA